MTRLLITGASGLLGANLVVDAAAIHEVVAVSRHHPVRHPGVQSVQADLAQAGKAQDIVRAARPAWIIHCAAATDVDACEVEPEMAFRLNRDMAARVAEAARRNGARLVHISTDAVFDGENGHYREADEPHPINAYGRSKLAGEEAVAAAHPEALIVRTNIYGWNVLPKRSLAEWFLANLEAGHPCRGFADVWVTTILVNDLGALLWRMLELGLEGIYHVAGAECVSKYDFGVRVAQVFGLDTGLIAAAPASEAALRAPRPRRLCLDCSQAERAIGLRMPLVEEGLRRFRALREDGHLDSLRASSEAGAERSASGRSDVLN
jgi:dTDP-4-dehydrorhamnose reductase